MNLCVDPDGAFLLFIGIPRSGHSIVGAIIDAHPNAIVSHELNVLKLLSEEDAEQTRIFNSILENSKRQAIRGRSQSHEDHGPNFELNKSANLEQYKFDYSIPNQFQGEWKDRLLVIGDKKGGGTTKLLGENIQLYKLLEETVNLPIKTIIVIRNPFDNIATMAHRSGNPVQSQIEAYEKYIQTITSLMDELELDAQLIFHEDFVKDSKSTIKKLLKWLKLPADEKFLADTSGIVNNEPNKSRTRVKWEQSEKNKVNRLISKYKVLEPYLE